MYIMTESACFSLTDFNLLGSKVKYICCLESGTAEGLGMEHTRAGFIVPFNG